VTSYAVHVKASVTTIYGPFDSRESAILFVSDFAWENRCDHDDYFYFTESIVEPTKQWPKPNKVRF
jgi:hypothetical protein